MSTAATAIRMFDYVEQYAAIQGEILAALQSVLASGSLILGPRVQAFEENFGRFLGEPGYAVGVGNGTDALAIALGALKIGPGDEVITVSNTAIPTVSAIRMAGATPVFCEIDRHSLLMDLTDAEARITARTKAIVPVHLFGNAVDMPRLMQIAQRHALAVVEDCAQSCGTTWQGRPTGTFGDVGCFSFYPTKNLGAYGDGGLCFTRRKELADAMRQIRVHGRGKAYYAEREGVNSRLDELQAAILEVKLRYLRDYLAKRRAIARMYHEHLAPGVVRPRVERAADHSYHLFVIASRQRDQIIERFKQEEIGFGIHYPTPIHRMSGYEFLGYRAGALPITERAATEVLSLPCYPELSLEAVRRVCSAVNDVVGKYA
ncbi:MAG: DegT/DnrJ/EryC1/StrS family aminotransferase [Planctomycetia bacterium]|nr:DegT/DnrJ/EryC1/StrS family aminotransferase [Planctomycetia bacterium]